MSKRLRNFIRGKIPKVDAVRDLLSGLPYPENRAGKTEYFHRSVVCMTVGKAPHVILGQEMLKPRDGAERMKGS